MLCPPSKVKRCIMYAKKYAKRQSYVEKVVAVLPHDHTAFTQGLAIDPDDPEIMYESTGLYGESSLRKVRWRTGEVVQMLQGNGDGIPPTVFGEGLAVANDKLYMLTWKSNHAVVFDKQTLKKNGIEVYVTEGWGLAHDPIKNIFWMSDGSSKLFMRDGRTFDIINSIVVGVERMNELEIVTRDDGKRELWANVWMTDTIIRFDMDTMKQLEPIDLSWLAPDTPRDNNNVLNGIAQVDKDHVYVTGKRWPKAFLLNINKL